jgi:hypothetical protein
VKTKTTKNWGKKMGRATEASHFLNQEKRAKKKEENSTYFSLTITTELDNLRKRIHTKRKKESDQG